MSRSKPKNDVISESRPDSAAAEAFRKLRTNIDYSHQGEGLKTIVITSAIAGEGKSTAAANLAAVYAQSHRKVLLIDADLRRPVQHELFHIEAGPGLGELLGGRATLHDVLIPVGDSGLTLLRAGGSTVNVSALFTSPQLPAALSELRDRFDYILVDTPALLDSSDAQIIAAECDGVLLVVKPGKVKTAAALKAKESLALVKARVLGAVLNHAKGKKAGRYSY
ncbi:CpsD/CapB family tyrosine-protein kinase [Paenibacillus sp. NFR01]|uniref:CpsD/CapB family tyrosine-protein kinase n=1 Tax=Paenibacillus sp. NFR01 TaxID=1566279 RepID=UPI0008C1DCF7|nr:CpsD/CapB family tyrosine-protein kinase [Paenibacillus sp. NFR01]SET99667.1 capsular exopolysaccharide family [Paenibacillus sp. NFR01]